MKLAYIFAGQGAQHVGMGTDFYETYPAYKAAVDALNTDGTIKTIMDEGPEAELMKTSNTQPCMAMFAIGVKAILDEMGIKADATCGLSIGEYGALYAAGMITAEDYLKLVTYRGKVMAEAAEGIECAMSAVVGLEASEVERAVENSSEYGFVTVANYNCPGQYVICGDEKAIEKCEELCKEMGAKQAIRLKVSGPFHTKYMSEAGRKLRVMLDETNFASSQIPLLLNTTGNYLNNESIPEVLEQQIQSGVHFEDQLVKLLEDGYDTFIEIGPGKTLSGFVKRTAKKLKVSAVSYSVDNIDDMKKLEEIFG